MSSSGQAPAIYASFIDRKAKTPYAVQPKIMQLSFGTDMRQFTGAFDFEVQFGPYEKITINSHDFVEFWFWNGETKFQIGVGFIEDFVKKTSATGNLFQGNGRDFLAQLMNFPFKTRVNQIGNSYLKFIKQSIADTYVVDYLKMKNLSTQVVDKGIFKGNMIFTDVATSPRAQVLQEYADLALNLIYLDRLGRVTVYGRHADSKTNVLDYSAYTIDETLDAYSDHNVVDMQIRENYSKVYTSATVIFQGMENLDSPSPKATVNSNSVRNSDPRVAGISQPITKMFSLPDLQGLAGQVGAGARNNQLAASIIRKSNQYLSQVIVICDAPYFVTSDGEKIPYEVGQVWGIKNDAFSISGDYKLAGIHYEQSPENIQVQLAFVEPDTLV